MAIMPLWDTLAATATPANAAHWTLLDIRAGIPIIHPETREAFVPQMANMQLIDGVSFTKGCYTGQEIVARMQYLGKLKRRLYLGEVTTERMPRPGDEVHCPSATPPRPPAPSWRPLPSAMAATRSPWWWRSPPSRTAASPWRSQGPC